MPHSFDRVLEVTEAELVLPLRFVRAIPWLDFFLNPRRLRGSDFLMRWSQGRWSEEMLKGAVSETTRYVAVPYGPSSTAPDNDVQAFERYFEELDRANPSAQKRPDMVILDLEDFLRIEEELQRVGGSPPNCPKLPFIPEKQLTFLLEKTVLAVECENSLWICKQMPSFGIPLRPMRRLGGKPGLPKSAIIPTIIVKDEDRERLTAWQRIHGIPIHIWHVFYDLGYGIALDDFERLIQSGEVAPRKQVFQGPGGQSQVKVTYNLPYYKAYQLCHSVEAPTFKADSITDKNGHVLPFVRFEGGKFSLTSEAIQVLDNLDR